MRAYLHEQQASTPGDYKMLRSSVAIVNVEGSRTICYCRLVQSATSYVQTKDRFLEPALNVYGLVQPIFSSHAQFCIERYTREVVLGVFSLGSCERLQYWSATLCANERALSLAVKKTVRWLPTQLNGPLGGVPLYFLERLHRLTLPFGHSLQLIYIFTRKMKVLCGAHRLLRRRLT
ncbi:hypothetical protein IF1G_11125 [Cordyceps javanica]|uniref:Uncharacterized protein n=1 Tax=Cordyceps javanica TaxID=43265 RepID=A0A545UL92_9HYPO|nr:hypothetical protein IF1G_11125 [Cordyceps javanica]